MQVSEQLLDDLIEQVRKANKYSHIARSLVREIVMEEIPKWKNSKEIIKSTRNKLHQVGSAFQQPNIPYAQWMNRISSLDGLIDSHPTKSFITECLRFHSSTSERLSFLTSFFSETLAPIQPVESILDLACGFTPLCLPWMPVTRNISYTGVDIYSDMISFLDSFFTRYKIDHQFVTGNILDSIPRQKIQVTFLLKTIPCLEQVDKTIGRRLLDEIRSENILVSFPSRSLGGKSKGMAVNYQKHFDQLVEGRNWHITKTEFANEIAFLIQK